ncbi:hypothetical protein SAMN05428982_3616 [Pseudoxanthomonas sp. CF385]|uniref:hypothetical protein n=1 Tax=Pseudoxanthomonas sp. CF385 TaxID=1881042 RepID=UPI00088ED1A2|nr:hypothetical protein [Pseudoxanthomonas sp. CF385]SDR20667.1 hypothetical protein SAMN05428982_3616 [Pseudoxanthomonas sp. CF385]
MKDRRDYEKAIEIVGSVIRAWDPYCLIAEGAPIDEFDGQIAKITARVPGFHSSEDAAQAISDIFSRSFGPDTFSAADCLGPAQQIFTELGRAELLPAA